MQLKELLDNIPLILQYWVPGFVFLTVFRFLTSTKSKDQQSGVLMSAVISYVLIAMTEILTRIISSLNFVDDSVLIKSGFAIIIGIIGSIICALVVRAGWFSKLLVALFHKTPNDNIWMDIIDFKEGSNLKIYEKGKDYYIIGHHYANEEKGNDSWFAVTAFSKAKREDDTIFENHSGNEKAVLAIRLSDIEHMEIF